MWQRVGAPAQFVSTPNRVSKSLSFDTDSACVCMEQCPEAGDRLRAIPTPVSAKEIALCGHTGR